jgi:hypothetical protein
MAQQPNPTSECAIRRIWVALQCSGEGFNDKRWTRSTLDIAEQIEAMEDRYEVLRDGAVVATEMHVCSPATRWYTQQQALYLYEEAGFISMQIFKEFSGELASAEDTVFSIVGMSRNKFGGYLVSRER